MFFINTHFLTFFSFIFMMVGIMIYVNLRLIRKMFYNRCFRFVFWVTGTVVCFFFSFFLPIISFSFILYNVAVKIICCILIINPELIICKKHCKKDDKNALLNCGLKCFHYKQLLKFLLCFVFVSFQPQFNSAIINKLTN